MVGGLVTFLFLAMIAEHSRRFYCSTACAKANGITPDRLRLFSFRRRQSAPGDSSGNANARIWNWRSALRRAVVVAAVVFLLSPAVAALFAGHPNAIYRSTVRLDAGLASSDPFRIQTMFETIKSEEVLGRVIEDLGLADQWALQPGLNEPLPKQVVINRLKKQIEVRQFRNTGLIEIQVFSSDPAEAAVIANRIAHVFTSLPQVPNATIIDLPSPEPRPFHLNKAQTIAWGAAFGIPLCVVAGGIVLLFSWLKSRKETAVLH